MTYRGTRFHGKSLRSAKAMLTAGWRWAPDTAPMNKMTAITIRAGATSRALYGTAWPANRALTRPPPTAARTRKKVPRTSANRRRRSYRSSQKSYARAIEFGCPRVRRATAARRASCCSGPSGWLVIVVLPSLVFNHGAGCAMLSSVDVDELRHALGGVVLEAAYLERTLPTAFSPLIGTKYRAVAACRLPPTAPPPAPSRVPHHSTHPHTPPLD